MYQQLARELRKNMTDEERLLWSWLRKRQVFGHKFRRQAPIGAFIVDFVCLERKLVVELDGSQHVEAIEQDEKRSRWLVSEGFRVLRFWNHEIRESMDGVLERIAQELQGALQTQDSSAPPP